jgi:tripartite-type tricarboxylate transporter receptor subunit TctC
MRRLALVFVMFLVGCGIAAAETYPARRITVIVPFGAGSGTDGVARVVTQRLAEVLKTAVVIENRAGANGTIGATAAARSPADGYTLFFGGSSTHSAAPSLLKSIAYSPTEDFVPIGRIGLFPYVLVINPGLEVKNVGELAALAKQKPGGLSFAYANALGQLSGEMLKRQAGIDLQAVPYKGSPEGVTDVIAGRVSMMVTDLIATLSLTRSGQLRALATITKDRSALLPDLPSVSEQGLDFKNLSAWTGLFAPKGTPQDVVDKLTETMRGMMAEPDVQKRLAEIGFEAKWTEPKVFKDELAADIALWAKLTKEAGIEPQ